VLTGRLPSSDDEIALGRLVAHSLGAGVGADLIVEGRARPAPCGSPGWPSSLRSRDSTGWARTRSSPWAGWPASILRSSPARPPSPCGRGRRPGRSIGSDSDRSLDRS
jgi:hypothetical protein